MGRIGKIEGLSLKLSSLGVRIISLSLAVAIILVWEYGSGVLFDPFFLSKPSVIIAQLVTMLFEGNLLYHMEITLYEAIIGFIIGFVLGVGGGYILGHLPKAYHALSPYVLAFYSTPSLAMAPLFVIWLGLGIESKIALAGLVVFFIMFLNVVSGVREVDTQLLDVMKVMKANYWEILAKVEFPSIIPWIISGARVTIPLAYVGAFAAEFISSNRGVGYLVQAALGYYDTPVIYVVLLVIAVQVLAMNVALNKIQDHLLSWRAKEVVVI
jgi:NitT/TauT family transport system permease protein